jgi:hypothetical protein
MAKPKIYAVARGREVGLFTSWAGPGGAQAQIDGFSKALYKSFEGPDARGIALRWLVSTGVELPPELATEAALLVGDQLAEAPPPAETAAPAADTKTWHYAVAMGRKPGHYSSVKGQAPRWSPETVIVENRLGGFEGLDENRGGLACPSSAHRLGHKIEQRTLLLRTGGVHAEHPLDKPAARVTPRTETALAPEHGVTKGSFGPIVRRFHPFHARKCPKRIPMPQHLSAEAGDFRVAAYRPVLELGSQGLLERDKRQLEADTVEPSSFMQAPENEQIPRQLQHALRPEALFSIVVQQRLQVAQQVCPTDLPALIGVLLVGPKAVRADNAHECLAEQMPQRRPTAALMHAKAGRHRTDRDPQPAFAGLGWPTGLIGIHHLGLAHHRGNCCIDRSQGLARTLTAGHDAGRTEGEMTDISQELGCIVETETVACAQDRHQGRGTRTKCTGWSIRRQVSRYQGATAGAAAGVLAVLSDVGANDRQFPDLGTAWLTKGRQLLRKDGVAVGTLRRQEFDRLIDAFRRNEWALMAFVPRLTTSLSSTWNLGWFGRR